MIQASIHRFEGQLLTIDGWSEGGCLRCLWPKATIDGLVGNCAEAGVLGPVPGVLGTLQALMALKVLLGLEGQLAGEHEAAEGSVRYGRVAAREQETPDLGDRRCRRPRVGRRSDPSRSVRF